MEVVVNKKAHFETFSVQETDKVTMCFWHGRSTHQTVARRHQFRTHRRVLRTSATNRGQHYRMRKKWMLEQGTETLVMKKRVILGLPSLPYFPGTKQDAVLLEHIETKHLSCCDQQKPPRTTRQPILTSGMHRCDPCFEPIIVYHAQHGKEV